MINQILDFCQCILPYSRFQLTFPHSHNPPPHTYKHLLIGFIPLFISLYFLPPKYTIGMRNMTIYCMAMPKAPIYKNNNTIFW